MANFCSKCGKKLEAGETHSCEAKKEEKKEEKKVEAKTTSESTVDIKEGLSDSLEASKGIFTKPVDTIKKFVCDSKFITGVFLILFTALLNGLSKVVSLAHAYSKYDGSAYKPAKPDYVDEFFKVFSMDLVKYVAIALVAYLIISVFLKGKATWKETVAATGLSLVVMACAIVVNTGLVFIEEDIILYIVSYVSTFATIFSTVVFYEGIKEKAGIDTNKLFVTCASIFVAAEIIVDLVNKIFE